ncbi:hypothetical protein JOM56_001558 [Amanita muscaria]
MSVRNPPKWSAVSFWPPALLCDARTRCIGHPTEGTTGEVCGAMHDTQALAATSSRLMFWYGNYYLPFLSQAHASQLILYAPSTTSGPTQAGNAFQHVPAPAARVFSIEVQLGTYVAPVGGSGCGKSVQLLERFYDPLTGEIVVLRLDKDQKEIVLVSQEPTLYVIRFNNLLGAIKEVKKRSKLFVGNRDANHS